MSLDAVGIRFTSVVDPNFVGNIESALAATQSMLVSRFSLIGASSAEALTSKFYTIYSQTLSKFLDESTSAKELKQLVEVASVLENISNRVTFGSMREALKDMEAILPELDKEFSTTIGLIENYKLAALESARITSLFVNELAQIGVKRVAGEFTSVTEEIDALDNAYKSLLQYSSQADPAAFLTKSGEQMRDLVLQVEVAASALDGLMARLSQLRTAYEAALAGQHSEKYEGPTPEEVIDEQREVRKAIEETYNTLKEKIQTVLPQIRKMRDEMRKASVQKIFEERAAKEYDELVQKLRYLSVETKKTGNAFKYHAEVIRLVTEYQEKYGRAAGYLEIQLSKSQKWLREQVFNYRLLGTLYKQLAEGSAKYAEGEARATKVRADSASEYVSAVRATKQQLKDIDADTYKYASSVDRLNAKIEVLVNHFQQWGKVDRELADQLGELYLIMFDMAKLEPPAILNKVLMGSRDEILQSSKAVKTYYQDLLELKEVISIIEKEEQEHGESLATVIPKIQAVAKVVDQYGDVAEDLIPTLDKLQARFLQLAGESGILSVGGTSAYDNQEFQTRIAVANKWGEALAALKSSLREIDLQEKAFGSTVETITARLELATQYTNKFGKGNAFVANTLRESHQAALQAIADLSKYGSQSQLAAKESALMAQSTKEYLEALKSVHASLTVIDLAHQGTALDKSIDKLSLIISHFDRFKTLTPALRSELLGLSTVLRSLAADEATFASTGDEQLLGKARATQEYVQDLRQLKAELSYLDEVQKLTGDTLAINTRKIMAIEQYTKKWGTANAEIARQYRELKATTQPFFVEMTRSLISTAAFQIRWNMSLRTLFYLSGKFREVAASVFDFQEQLKNLQAITNATEYQLSKLRDIIVRTASDSKFSLSEIAEATRKLGQAGLDTSEVVQVLPTIINLATASFNELGKTVDLVTTAMKSFNLTASRMSEVSDIMASAINVSKLDAEKLGTAFNYVASTGNIVGASIREVVTALGVLVNAGVRASTAATGLRNVLGHLVAPNQKFLEIMTRLGLTIEDIDPRLHGLATVLLKLKTAGADATAAFELFGLRGGNAFAALVSGANEYIEIESVIGRSGAAADMAAKQMESFSGQAKRFWTIISGGASSLTSVLDVLAIFLKYVNDIAAAMVKFLSTDYSSPVKAIAADFIKWGSAVFLATKALMFLKNLQIVKLFSQLYTEVIQIATGIQVTTTATQSLTAAMGAFLRVNVPLAIIGTTIAALYNIHKKYNETLDETYNKVVKQGHEVTEVIKSEYNRLIDVKKELDAIETAFTHSDKNDAETMQQLGRRLQRLGYDLDGLTDKVDKGVFANLNYAESWKNIEKAIQEARRKLDADIANFVYGVDNKFKDKTLSGYFEYLGDLINLYKDATNQMNSLRIQFEEASFRKQMFGWLSFEDPEKYKKDLRSTMLFITRIRTDIIGLTRDLSDFMTLLDDEQLKSFPNEIDILLQDLKAQDETVYNYVKNAVLRARNQELARRDMVRELKTMFTEVRTTTDFIKAAFEPVTENVEGYVDAYINRYLTALPEKLRGIITKLPKDRQLGLAELISKEYTEVIRKLQSGEISPEQAAIEIFKQLTKIGESLRSYVKEAFDVEDAIEDINRKFEDIDFSEQVFKVEQQFKNAVSDDELFRALVSRASIVEQSYGRELEVLDRLTSRKLEHLNTLRASGMNEAEYTKQSRQIIVESQEKQLAAWTKYVQNKQQLVTEAINILQDYVNRRKDLFDSLADIEKDLISFSYDSKLAELEIRLAQRLISEKQFNDESIRLTLDRTEKELEVEKTRVENTLGLYQGLYNKLSELPNSPEIDSLRTKLLEDSKGALEDYVGELNEKVNDLYDKEKEIVEKLKDLGEEYLDFFADLVEQRTKLLESAISGDKETAVVALEEINDLLYGGPGDKKSVFEKTLTQFVDAIRSGDFQSAKQNLTDLLGMLGVLESDKLAPSDKKSFVETVLRNVIDAVKELGNIPGLNNIQSIESFVENLLLVDPSKLDTKLLSIILAYAELLKQAASGDYSGAKETLDTLMGLINSLADSGDIQPEEYALIKQIRQGAENVVNDINEQQKDFYEKQQERIESLIEEYKAKIKELESPLDSLTEAWKQVAEQGIAPAVIQLKDFKTNTIEISRSVDGIIRLLSSNGSVADMLIGGNNKEQLNEFKLQFFAVIGDAKAGFAEFTQLLEKELIVKIKADISTVFGDLINQMAKILDMSEIKRAIYSIRDYLEYELPYDLSSAIGQAFGRELNRVLGR